jgi:hypothetical protein
MNVMPRGHGRGKNFLPEGSLCILNGIMSDENTERGSSLDLCERIMYVLETYVGLGYHTQNGLEDGPDGSQI